jgi:hypothetical protein
MCSAVSVRLKNACSLKELLPFVGNRGFFKMLSHFIPALTRGGGGGGENWEIMILRKAERLSK